MSSKGPEVNTKGSSRTTCTVIIDTHDRGPKLKGQRIDISPYITQVTIDAHLTGGGQASISLPAVQHIEDIVAAGDLVNIYFNLHRNDVDKYSKGNVRTFFGYIDSVHKSVNVDGSGAKITSYSLTCTAFDKAVKETQIYNNPHLVSQEGKTDVVRRDFANNLGGAALLNKGISTRGTPRDLIIRNLLRMLGFGGQFVLPAHYQEVLPKAVRSVTFKEASVTQEKLIFSKEAMEELTEGDIKSVLESIFGDGNKGVSPAELGLTEQLMRGNISYDSLIVGIEQSKFIEFNKNLLQTIARLSPKARSRMVQYLPMFSHTQDSNNAFVSNTFFEIATGIDQETISTITGLSNVEQGSVSTGVLSVLHDQLAESYIEIKEFAGGKEPAMFPSVNMWAGPNGLTNPAKTIFNILSLDYLEDVDGYYGSFGYIHFSGSLWSALYQNSNSIINELFFDLRPAANFKEASVDGLGIDIDGAMPMVPAVVLRERPLTNYRDPKRRLSAPENTSTIKIGGTGRGVPGQSPVSVENDQLYMSILAQSGASRGISALKENIDKVKGMLEKLGYGVTITTDGPVEVDYNLSVPGFTKVGEPVYSVLGKSPKKGLLNIDTSSFISDEVNKSNKNAEEQIASLGKLLKQEVLTLSPPQVTTASIANLPTWKVKEKAFSTIFALPRPVFRSPDGGRVTVENKSGGVQRILGLAPVANTQFATNMGFFAFTDSNASQSTVGNIIGQSTYTTKGAVVNPDNKANLVLSPGSKMSDIHRDISESTKKRVHILEFVSVRSQDVMNESFSRGDHGVINLLELFPNIPGAQAQKLYFNDQLPIVTPISIHRFGLRVSASKTDFVDPAFLGISDDFWNQKSMIMKWNVLLDMWNQHNHEYLTGTIGMRGLPGIRVGYRLDRPELNLSFYVERVSHTWTYPGHLATSVSVTRGQPMTKETALDYIPPSPNINANDSERQTLGKVFPMGEDEDGKARPYAGTFTGELIKPKTRGDNVAVSNVTQVMGNLIPKKDEVA